MRGIQLKTCQRCNREISKGEFCKNSRRPDGLNTWCRECTREYKTGYYAQNKERLLDKARGVYAKDADSRREAQKARYWSNPEKHRELACRYQRENCDSVNARHREWSKKKRETDIQYKLRTNLRSRLLFAVRKRGTKKAGSAVRDLGCSVSFLVEWLEGKFSAGMSWDNYGSAWHIDHIIPLSLFDLTNSEQAKKACHYTNLQPLFASENIRKGGANRKEIKHEFDL